jgi:ribosomal protein L22
MVDAMTHITPETANAIASFNSSLRLLNGVTDDNKVALHTANTRSAARKVMQVLTSAIAEAETSLLPKGEKVGVAGKFTIVRRGKAYEEADALLKALRQTKATFAREQALHLSTPVTALGGDSSRWPSWAWAK